MKKTSEKNNIAGNKIKICPKCGSKDMDYSPGMDIGMIYASCANCKFKDNQHSFPMISKEDARKVKVIKGNKLAPIAAKNIMINRSSKWIAVVVIIIMITAAMAMLL